MAIGSRSWQQGRLAMTAWLNTWVEDSIARVCVCVLTHARRTVNEVSLERRIV